MNYIFNPLVFKQLMWILSLSGHLSVMDWRSLCNGHQTGIPNYSIFPLNLTHTRTLLNYGQIVCKLVALSQWTLLYS
jgi:hypothetical protein